MKIYFNTNRRCMLCDQSVDDFGAFSLYFVGARAAIAYLLCGTCRPKTSAGLPPDDLRELDAKLAAHAKSLGLSVTH